MSTEQEDAAILLELEEKITRRIREQLFMVFLGVNGEPGSVSSASLDIHSLRGTLRSSIINDPYVITELTKKIGTKMANVQY